MKKTYYLLLLMLLLVPLKAIAVEKCDNSNIVINSIEQTNKSEGVEEKTNATIENNQIILDIKMSEVDDYIEYEFNVENNSEEDLIFNEKSITSEDNHFNYEFSYEDNSNVIKSKEDKDITLTVTYTREIEEDDFENGIYQMNETSTLGITNLEISNPKTVSYFKKKLLLILGVFVLFGLICIKNKKGKVLVVALGLIPLTVDALCSYEMKISSTIEVSNISTPNSFAEDSWSTIIHAVRSGDTSAYSVGDLREIELDGLGTHNLRIANKTTTSECSGSNYSQTACGFVIEFEDIIEKRVLNEENTTVGGWRDCTLRTYLNEDIYNLLPKALRDGIIDTKVLSGYYSGDGVSSNYITTDKLYLVATKEVHGAANRDTVTQTRQLDYYYALVEYTDGAKKFGETKTAWWTRSVYSTSGKSYNKISSNGGWEAQSPNIATTGGVSPVFRIG